MKEKIPVILSIDTGIDDAVSILLALKCKNIEIKLFVCSYGNTSIDHVATNTLGILDLANAPQIPILRGSIPSEKRQKLLYKAHGSNGMGGYIFNKTNRTLSTECAEDKIYEIANKEKNLHYINLGPSTTLASTIKKYPDINTKIKKIIFMGGSLKEKLDTKKPYTEFNIASDPESAEIVFNSKIPILMVPSEIGRKAFLDYYDIYKTKKLNKTGEILELIFRNYKHRRLPYGVATCDSTALLSLTHPEIMEIKPVYGFIKYFKNVDTGVCLFDFAQESNMEVVTDIDVKKFKKVYFNLLSKLP